MDKNLDRNHIEMKSKDILWLLPFAFLALFYFYPLLTILRLFFSQGDAGEVIWDAAKSTYLWRITGFTIWQACLSTILTLIVGLPGAYIVARYRFPGKSIFKALTGVPFVLPPIVTALAFDSLMGTRGWVNTLLLDFLGLGIPPLRFSQTFGAIIVAHVFYNTTIVLRIVGDFWSRLDPRLTAAARVLGANRWTVLRTILLPILWPAIATAGLLVFIFDFTSFGVVLILGGPHFSTLETEIYYQTTALFNLPYAAVLAVIQIGCTTGLTLLFNYASARRSQYLNLRSPILTQRPLHAASGRIIYIVILGALICLLILPILSLAVHSFFEIAPRTTQGEIFTGGITMAYYQQLFTGGQISLFDVSPLNAMRTSISYAAITVILSLSLGLPTAWLLSSSNQSGSPSAQISRFFNSLILLPLGTSALTLGFGFIIAFGQRPLDLRSSPFIIPLAHTLVAFPFVVRSLTPAIASIGPRIRHAAEVLGASPWKVIRTIDLPLIGRALIVAATFAFTISLGEFGATTILSRPEFPTIPIAIFRSLSRPGVMNYGQAIAMSTLLMACCLAGMLAIERMRISSSGEL